jgi:SHS2 domain-containing protein
MVTCNETYEDIMPPVKKYEYMEHTADARFRAYGDSPAEAFANAAEAMFNVMADTSGIECKKNVAVEVNSDDPEMLLVDWLSELLYHFEVDSVIFGTFTIHKITTSATGCHLSATACGEPTDPGKHSFQTEVKAVTYNHLLFEETDGGVMVQVTVDT